MARGKTLGKTLRIVLVCLILGVLFGVSSAVVNAAADPGSISGVVYIEEGESPIEGAYVSASGNSWGSDYTEADGSYIITDLAPGLYVVRVEASGYVSEYYDSVYDSSSAVPVMVMQSCDTPEVDFSLWPGGEENQPPDQPTNISPSNGAVDIGLTPTLESSAFSDPDSGDTHAASQWQVTTVAGDYTSPVFDSGTDTSNLTSIAISSLAYSTTYYWHVRYQDSPGDWSSWSSETSFSTAPPPNQPPDQPTNISPSDGAVDIGLTPTLESSAFSDPDSGDTHAASQWQVTTVAGDYTSPVFDSGAATTDLTQIMLSAGVLTSGTTYYWHVRYQDNHGTWSSWSSETSFSTAVASLTGYVQDGYGHKLGGVEVTLLGLSPVVTITDDGGQYSFADIAPGTYQIEIALECHEMVGDPATFSINYDAGPTVHAQTDNFQVPVGAVAHDISFADPSLNPAPGIPKDRLDDLAAMYYHTKQAVDFAQDTLRVTLNLDLPLEVHAYSGMTTDAEYSPGTKEIYISEAYSAYTNPSRPMNCEWHEFFHYMMDDADLMPTIPSGYDTHGGFNNPSTMGSWIEGWAEFWSCALKQSLGESKPYEYAGGSRKPIRINIETSLTPWSSVSIGSGEEFAVAGLLWDLIDPTNNREDDFIQIPLSELWGILDDGPIDGVRSLYVRLTGASIGLSDTDANGTINLDELFAEHGFFGDKADKRGNYNHKWEPGKGELAGYGGKEGRL